jgi:hypothetical protein
MQTNGDVPRMNNLDEKPDDPARPVDGRVARDPGEKIYPESLVWLRQLTLREIIAKPWLIIYQPRLWLEKPWLPVVLLGSVGLVKGIISGVEQGEGEGIGKMAEGVLVCGFMGGVISAIIMVPLALGLWVMREAAARFSARRSTSQTNDSRRAAPLTVGELRQYPYRPNRLLVVFLFLVCVGGESLSCFVAIEDHDIFASIMAIIGPFGLIVILALLISAFTQEWRVAFTDDEIIVPKPHWPRVFFDEIRIAFRDIVSLKFTHAGIILNHRQGRYFLSKVMFPSRNDFDCVTALLADSVVASRQKETRATDDEDMSGQEHESDR